MSLLKSGTCRSFESSAPGCERKWRLPRRGVRHSWFPPLRPDEGLFTDSGPSNSEWLAQKGPSMSRSRGRLRGFPGESTYRCPAADCRSATPDHIRASSFWNSAVAPPQRIPALPGGLRSFRLDVVFRRSLSSQPILGPRWLFVWEGIVFPSMTASGQSRERNVSQPLFPGR